MTDKRSCNEGVLPAETKPDWVHYPAEAIAFFSQIQSDFLEWWILPSEVARSFFDDLQRIHRKRQLVPFAKRFDSDTCACFEKDKGEAVQMIDLDASPGHESFGEFRSFAAWRGEAEAEALTYGCEELDTITSDPRYLKNLRWGETRPGHTEGSIAAHIDELSSNLREAASFLSPLQAKAIELMIHTHDTFKGESRPNVPIEHPDSHASLARQFIASISNRPKLEDMVQYHDEPYALWKGLQEAGMNHERRERFLSKKYDWNIFSAFVLIDNITTGKDLAPTRWALDVLVSQVHTTIDLEGMYDKLVSRIHEPAPEAHPAD